LKQWGDMAHKFTSITNALTTIFNGLFGIFKWCYFKVTGQSWDGSEEIVQKVQDLITRLHVIRTQLLNQKTTDNTKEFIETYEQIRSYILSGNLHKLNQTCGIAASSAILTCMPDYDACYAFSQQHKARFEPIGVHLVGMSGVGKTSIKEILIAFLKKYVYATEEIEVFDRKAANEYWEGYNKQKITVVDDIFQVQDINQRCLQALEYIYMVNVNPYHLHMAKMENKSGTFFSSEWVITTSNYTQNCYLPAELGIVDYSALYRRMTLKFLVENSSKLDLEKLGRKITFDDLKDTVKLYPILGENQKGSPINLKTFLTLCKDKYDKRMMTDDLDVLGDFLMDVKPLVPDGLVNSKKRATQSKEESESLTSDGEASGGITNTILPPPNRAIKKPVDAVVTTEQPKPALRVKVLLEEESSEEIPICECEGEGCLKCNICPQCDGEGEDCTACEGKGYFSIPPESGDEGENSREEKNREYQADMALLHPVKKEWRAKAQSGNGGIRSNLEGMIEYNVNNGVPFPCRHKECLQIYNKVKKYYFDHQVDFHRKFGHREDYVELAKFLAKRKNARVFFNLFSLFGRMGSKCLFGRTRICTLAETKSTNVHA